VTSLTSTQSLHLPRVDLGWTFRVRNLDRQSGQEQELGTIFTHTRCL
jgi:hypothetical protein